MAKTGDQSASITLPKLLFTQSPCDRATDRAPTAPSQANYNQDTCGRELDGLPLIVERLGAAHGHCKDDHLAQMASGPILRKPVSNQILLFWIQRALTCSQQFWWP